MKIIFLNTVYKTTSTGNISSKIFEYAKKRGNECLFLYGRGERSPAKDIIRICSPVEFLINCFLSRVFGCSGLFSFFSTAKTIKYIKRFKPDLINIHNLHGYYINIRKLLNYLSTTKIKVVFTLHDCWLFTGHCSHFEMIGCEKYLSKCSNCPQAKVYPKSLFFDDSKRMFKIKFKAINECNNGNLFFVSPSNWLASVFKNSAIGKDKHIFVINNGIDTKLFINNDNNLSSGIIYFIGVASPFDRAKGLYDFLKLSKMFPDDWKLILVGLNKKQVNKIKQNYKNIVPIMRTQSKIELINYYKKSLAFINLTYQDTYPTVNLEALSLGLPIVTYDSGGSLEASGLTPFYSKKGDLDRIFAHLKKIADLPSKRSNFSQFFDISSERMVSEYLNYFDKIYASKQKLGS